MVNPFVTDPHRDASKAIMGFFYQAELTVLRWLDLDASTVLYCEAGEDIDHVAATVNEALQAPEPPTSRLLEQVKAREGRLTLRSPEALTALARFREAIRKNPSQRLLYRFSTNAAIGQERGGAFPRGLSGIVAWELARTGVLDGAERQQFVATLKSLVADAKRPADLPEPGFTEFQLYLAQAEPEILLDEFVGRFEWAMALTEPKDLRDEIQARLVGPGPRGRRRTSCLLR